MELVLLLVVAVGIIGWWIWKEGKSEEAGKHPLDGATKAPEPWPFPVATDRADNKTESNNDSTSVLDVNKDGKVDLKDAVAAADIVVTETKKVAKKTKAKAQEVVNETKKTTKKAKEKVQNTVNEIKKSKQRKK